MYLESTENFTTYFQSIKNGITENVYYEKKATLNIIL